MSCADADPNPGEIAASHILIAYAGARRAARTVTRTKSEAFRRANTVLRELRAGARFGDMRAKYSDEPSAAAREGKLGRFPRGRMVKPFEDAAFALPIGGLSEVVETSFGYHIILRTE